MDAVKVRGSSVKSADEFTKVFISPRLRLPETMRALRERDRLVNRCLFLATLSTAHRAHSDQGHCIFGSKVVG